MAEEHKRVEIGFGIGQVLSVKLADDALAELRRRVEDGSGWYDVKISEGSVALNLATVVFIRAADGGHSIGFAG